LNNGRTLGYARGLFLDTNRGGSVVWHSGGSAGYGTFLVRFPEQALSVASMCNAGDTASGGAYARRIFDLFVPATTNAAGEKAPAAPGDGSALDAEELKMRTGLFFNETTGQPLRLGADSGRLRVLGGPVLETVTKDRFRNPRGALSFMSQGTFELNFVSPDRIELTSMEGAVVRYRRAQAFAPTADELKAFAGRYGNDESRAVFEIEPAKAGLTARISWNGAQAFSFVPVDRDTFQMAGMIIRFRRGGNGQIVGLDYSNPVVRNIAFTRLGDGTEGR
jgi:hypothetical protein